MQIIPLQSLPAQSFQVTLSGQSCAINITQRNTGLFIDLYVGGTLIVGGAICQDRNRIVRDAYLGFIGDLSFVDTQGQSDPYYSGLGAQYILVYLDPFDVIADT